MKLYAVYGTSGCGRGVMPVAREMLKRQVRGGDFELIFLDDNPGERFVNGYKTMTYHEFIKGEAEAKQVNIAIANSTIREKLARRCERDGIRFFSVIARNALLMDANEIAESATLCPFVTITSNVRIGCHFHANIYSYIEHDCVIGDFVTLAPRVCCNGNVVIEDHAYIGNNAILRQGTMDQPLVIGRGAVVGMGAVVTKNVPAGVTVIGNPARILAK